MNFLFQNFLTDKKVYNLNEAYYNRLFRSITGKAPIPYYNIRFNNGEKFYDGNPIFSALAGDRLLRIIQEEPESERMYLRASLEKTPEEEIDELVITLELSREAKPLLEALIRKWLVERLDREAMARFIEKKAPRLPVQPKV